MTIDQNVDTLLARMTLEEKIGQMRQLQAGGADSQVPDQIRRGRVGSVLNAVGALAWELQNIARKESRLGIPLIIGRDVIHGFETVLPIPLGQAASFDPDLVREGARMAAREALSAGVNWTFAPMVDIARDPRWGRIAEGCGEDPVLASRMGQAMVEGFQGLRPSRKRRKAGSIGREGLAACAKHYVGYGAAEGGRDYNTTLIPEGVLRNVYLAPFHACVMAGTATLMSAFNELNDIPASGNEFTIRKILKKEWRFDGFVVSDWTSITEMVAHGFCADHREAARAGVRGGVDMEMVSPSYINHLEELLRSGEVSMEWIDDAVRRILRVKMRLGLFDRDASAPVAPSVRCSEPHRKVALQAATESCVLLKNEGILPLAAVRRLAVIGPLADSPADQMGCWAMDGKKDAVQTPLQALRERLGESSVVYARGAKDCRDPAPCLVEEAVAAAKQADVVLLFIGEDAGLSGEAHSRAYLDVPGVQEELVKAVASTGRPVVTVVMAGRPLTMGSLLDRVQAVLWAWHPGTMGGPAIADLLFGKASPSGRLPVSFPRTTGQIPLYYAKKNTGRPPKPGVRGVPSGTPLDPKDFTSRYLDEDYDPQFAFGFGLTYTSFTYAGLSLSAERMTPDGTLTASMVITNTGARAGVAIPQLYIRDWVASGTRPVRELKQFQRITLEPGETRTVCFTIGFDDLAFYNARMKRVVEPGRFQLWIAPDSTCSGVPSAEFDVVANEAAPLAGKTADA